MAATKRKYDSSNRDAQAAQTRQRILDATVSVLGDGIAALTIPAVAQQAGVSVPTVYRYFPDKDALVDAASRHVRASIGIQPELAADLDEYLAEQREIHRRLAAADTSVLGATLATVGRGDSMRDIARRRAYLAPLFEPYVEHMTDPDREYALTTAAILGSSVGGTAFRQFGIEGDEAADLCEWILHRVLGSTTTSHTDGTGAHE